jgi:hypothetical protein
VPEPPAEVHVAEQKRGAQRGHEPCDADGDEQLSDAAREEVRSQGPHLEQAEACEAEEEDCDRERARRLGHGRNEMRVDAGCHAERDHDCGHERERDEQRPNGVGPGEARDRAQGEERCADGERRAARERDDSVVTHEHARRRDPVQAEERGHHRECSADENGASVVAHGSRDRERDRRRHRSRRREGDEPEMHGRTEVDHVLAHELHQERGHAGHGSGDCEAGYRPLPHTRCVSARAGRT